jgi:3'-5' exoribonuclease
MREAEAGINEAGGNPTGSGGRAPRRAIADLRPGERVEDEIYRIAQKDLRTTTNGSLYIHAVLADASGQMPARMWNASQELFESIGENGLIHVRGRVESYKGRPQFIIDGLRRVEEGTADAEEFLPRARGDPQEMWQRLKQILRGIRDPDLLALVARFINDEHFAARFRRAPAARSLHHAVVGGLLEHTLNVLEVAGAVLPRYPQVNADLVLAGIFLHDAGKTAELEFKTGFEYTNEGQLVGHIVQACIWVHEAARQVGEQTGRPFPPDTLNALKHIILSHHGRYEFGSPKLPATPEALMVHHLDNLDAKLNMMLTAIECDPDESSDWTQWIPALETRVFKPGVVRRGS